MDIQFCRSPTLAETKALASLPSKAPLKYDGVYEVLAEILAFCGRPDINGFLFTKEPIQVSHFLKPNVHDGAFAGIVLATRVEPGKELNKTQITDHSTGSFLVYPAFVSQNLSFGFAVNNIIYSPANAWEADQGFSYNSELRYVRDNDKRVLLSVADAEDVDIVQLQYTRLISTTCQQRTVACFVRRDFKAVTAKNDYDVTDVLRTMFHLHTGLEYRICPICIASNGECRCDLPKYEPKHPFDKEMVVRNMQMHQGTFQGTAKVANLVKGNFSASASVGSRMTIQGRLDTEKAERLQRWVLKKYCGSQSPWQSSLFAIDDHIGRTIGSSSFDDSNMETSTEELLRTLGINSPLEGGVMSPHAHENCGYLSEMPPGMEPGDRETSDATTAFTNPAIIMTEPQETSAQSSAGNVWSSPTTIKKESFKLSGQGKQRTKGEPEFDEIQSMKEERRKEQNRMSARRSNQKKKAFNDALKRDLRETHERAASLRARELELRKENLELRKRLEGQ